MKRIRRFSWLVSLSEWWRYALYAVSFAVNKQLIRVENNIQCSKRQLNPEGLCEASTKIMLTRHKDGEDTQLTYRK